VNAAAAQTEVVPDAPEAGPQAAFSVFLPVIRRETVVAGLANGNFEAGATGWTVASTFGRTVIRTNFVGSVVPHSGQYAAWLGGLYNETTAIQQKVTVSAGAPYLTYWHWIASGDVCGSDKATVRVNGAVVNQYDLCTGTRTNGWAKYVVNLSAYAGQTVTLQIRATTDFSFNSNLFIDDVGFQATASAAADETSEAPGVPDDGAEALDAE
jgi:hypothetical protein